MRLPLYTTYFANGASFLMGSLIIKLNAYRHLLIVIVLVTVTVTVTVTVVVIVIVVIIMIIIIRNWLQLSPSLLDPWDA